MIRRIAFVSGLVLGSGLCAWALGSTLVYLFTGQFPSLQIGRGAKPSLRLVDTQGLYEVPTLAGDAGGEA